MDHLDQLVQTHGIKLLIAGYAGNHHPVTALKQYTDALYQKLLAVNSRPGQLHIIHQQMHAQFNDGRPVEWDFTLRYHPEKSDLSPYHLKATLYDTAVNIPLAPLAQYPGILSAEQALKRLQQQVVVSHQKRWYRFKIKKNLFRKNHRLR